MSTVRLGPVVVTFEARDERYAWHVAWFLGSLPRAIPPAAVQIVIGTDATVPVDTQPTMIDGPMDRWIDESTMWVWHEEGATASVVGNRIEIDPGEVPPDDWRPTRQLLFSTLSFWAETQGLLLLHGALVGRGGDGLLVLGSTGAGKSTIAVAGLAHGWEVASDDLVLVDPTTPTGLDIVGVPKRMTVSPELAVALGSSTEPLPGDDRGRVVLPAEALSRTRQRLRGIVVAGHDDGGGMVESMQHAEVLDHVLEASIEAQRPEVLRRRLGAISRLAGLPATRVLHARDPGRRLRRASTMLGQALNTALGDGARSSALDVGIERR